MTLVLERTLSISPQAAFDAWLDPAALAIFMCPQPGGSVGKVTVDARVGGRFLITMIVGGKELPHHGEYLEIERYTRLAFTWRSHHAGDGSRVLITFAPADPAGRTTRLVLEHSGLDEAAVAPHTVGWTNILERLATTA